MTSWTKKTTGGFPTSAPTDQAPSEEPKESAEETEATQAEAGDGGPDETKPEVDLPSGWSEQRRAKPKTWGMGVRTDSPDKRTVHPPLSSGIGDGKSFLFLFGLKIHSPLDQEFHARMREHVEDDIEVLRQAGYTVAVDDQATHDDFVQAVYGEGDGVQGVPCAGLVWSAHGLADGSIETCDGGVVRPEDIEADKVSPALKLVVFASCYVGNRSRTWRKALGGHPLVVGWGRPVTVDRAVEFFTPDDATETDLDDLIRRYLLTDTPVPGMMPSPYSPMADLTASGHTGDLAGRMATVIEMLGGKWNAEEKWIWVDVPLGEKRWHKAKVFVVESTAPFTEGEPLLAVESDIGEITDVVDPQMLLAGVLGVDFARIALVESETDMPRMVAQGFLPLVRVRDQDLAALIFHVCSAADTVEQRVFGGDMG